MQAWLGRARRVVRGEFIAAHRDVAWLGAHRLVVAAACGLAVGLLLIGIVAWRTQLPFAAQLANVKQDHLVDQPIVIELEQAVQDSFKATISPEVEGEWQTGKSVLGVDSITFTPRSTFTPDTHYVIRITHLKRVTGQGLPNIIFTVTTQKAPEVTGVVPVGGTEHIATESEIIVTLATTNNGLRQLRPVLDPVIELVAQTPQADDTSFRWLPAHPLKQGQTYTLLIFDDKSVDPTKPLVQSQFRVVDEPRILEATQNDHFYPGDVIDVVFDTPMRQDRPGLQCACQGKGEWKSNVHFRFLPETISPGHTYDYVVPEGLTSEHGGRREADSHYNIKTPGHVVASLRGLGRSAPTNSPITITFDQAVVRSTAEARFGISPHVNGSFRWNSDSVMVFVPSGLEQQTEYRVSLAPGVQPARFGLDSVTTFSTSFTTAAPVVKLNVPVYRQQHRSSCEAAALRMALAYRGIQDNDWNIVQRMGYNGNHKDQANNYWDDPNDMYVGDVNGAQSAFQGYGAYGPPIAKAAQSYGRGATVYYGVSTNFIAEQIHAGNPVIIIGTSSGNTTIYTSWNGPNGVVHAWLGEHARTVIGVTGKASAPLSFIVNDPLYGRQETWSPGRLIDDINAIPQLASQVVVIR